MEIINLDPDPRLVDEWEFHFREGSTLGLTVDESNGDSVDIQDTKPHIRFSFGEKVSRINPEQIQMAEDIYVSVANTLWFSKRKRSLVEPSVEEREAWTKLLEELADTNEPN